MIKIFFVFFASILFPQSSNLFISEYAETQASTDRYIEIYNGTENLVDLSEYALVITKMGGNSYSYEISLNNTDGDSNNDTGTLASEEVLLIIKSDHGNILKLLGSCSDPQYDNADDCEDDNDCYGEGQDCEWTVDPELQYIEWNDIAQMSGDDTVELFHNDILIDTIGNLNGDPGASWDVGYNEGSTKDFTLVRHYNIIDGSTVWTNALENLGECIGDEDVGCMQWLVYDRNTFDFGGYHSFIPMGCMDPFACNYNDEAINDDGFCNYAEENFDCEGTCVIDEDCLGVCGGDAEFDECGECNGNNMWCADCNGDPDGLAFINLCNTCVEGNTGLQSNDCVGCLEIDACNYNTDANIAGDCDYPNECGICNAAYTHCESENVDFLTNWNKGNPVDESLGGGVLPMGLRYYSDIWGYTDLNGTEFALIASWDGTHIIDISVNPPEEIGFIEGAMSIWRDIKTFGSYMYVGTEAWVPGTYQGEEGIQVVDLSDPYNPVLVTEWDLINSSHNIMEHNGYLYIVGSSNDVNQDGNVSDLIVLDLTDSPGNPQYIAEWAGHYLHDVCMHEDRLYGCGIQNSDGSYDDKMFAFDISDPSNVNLIGQWDGVYAAHACWVSDDGNTVFTGSEFSGGHIMSFDVSDINNINFLDSWMPEGGEVWSAHNLFVKDNHLYISYYVYGLQVLDVSDPSNMVLAAYYDTMDEVAENSGLFDSVWGAFPYFESNKTIISDRGNGLIVLDVNLLSQGDINQDGIINVVDIIYVIGVIFGENQFLDSADINTDGVIDVFDIVLLVEIILYQD